MTLQHLIQTNHWPNVEHTLLELYSDQSKLIDGYNHVFETLKNLKPTESKMLIELSFVQDNFEDESNGDGSYVHVSGREIDDDSKLSETSYAIEFVPWENWLGMGFTPETKANYTELEIIAHCLFEMTFCGFDQEKIQAEMQSIQDSVDEIKNMSPEERETQLISLDDFMKKWKSDSDESLN